MSDQEESDEHYHAPFITVEGGNDKANKSIIRALSQHNTFHTMTSIQYSESVSIVGTLLYRDDYDSIELPNLVHYQLRNANLWEVQDEIKSLTSDKITVISSSYVLSNRARMLSTGMVGKEFCCQLDAGLLKPDLQIHLQSDPVPLTNRVSTSRRDTFQSRIQIVESFKELSKNDQDIKTIIYQCKEDLDICKDQARSLFDEAWPAELSLTQFKYFDGYS